MEGFSVNSIVDRRWKSKSLELVYYLLCWKTVNTIVFTKSIETHLFWNRTINIYRLDPEIQFQIKIEPSVSDPNNAIPIIIQNANLS